ncbi:LytS/YhcK type 5TM receptor domain-containing protein [Clostridium sp. OS1-26]|uniref:LytS/YhcK type 5TM receptor domain-containing protein n=1 Tax=Clostridium sp. OS1-26 TaxID=3070681 RepID=UPI0027DFD66E|nr:LytS/YhcK type 5TM receptor domain-containing protein [Clostridium sp. OS1-26]WML36067.1 LytS/YhcK type 5TM receptor domain-containing protein [Clostridium sp. OS1-26]
MIYIQLLERMALIALAAYIYNQSHIFKNLIKDELKIKDKIGMIVFFSILSIIGTYTGINLEPYAIANTRPIGAIVGGYVGGPVVGVAVGLIAGTHRFLLGGFTGLACGIATVVEGIVGALARKYSKDGAFSAKNAFLGAVVAESFQMLILLIFSRPLEDAVELVKFIAMPMILINSFGVIIFINIIQNARNEYNRIGAIKAQEVLNIAKRTMGHMRKGLSEETAKSVAEIICEISNIKGVFIGDKKGLLTYCGEKISEDKLKNNLEAYYECPDYSVIKFTSNNKQVFFVCAPFLVSNVGFEGVLGLKVKSEKSIDSYFWEFAKELSDLLSTQIELHKLNKLAEEASVAEFKALRAQIEPHFLFNALNTISSFCRTNPVRARELIIDLSNYFRQTLKRAEDFVLLKDEVEFLQSYLSIEKARFGERLKLIIDIPEDMMNIKMPVFILQPIIENSIKHGILPKPEGGSVLVKASYIKNEVIFSIEDTGMGMEKEKLAEVTTTWPGIGLKNVNERLKLLYGEGHELNINTSLNYGTKVSFLIPKEV